MSVRVQRITLSQNDFIPRGSVAWQDFRGSVVAVDVLYDATDPTDALEEFEPPTAPFIVSAMVHPDDYVEIKKLMGI